MKNLFLKLFLILATTGLLTAETRVDIKHLIARSPGQVLLVITEEGDVVAAQLGQGLKVDWTTTPPTIYVHFAIEPTTMVEKSKVIFRPTALTPDFKIPEAFNPVSLEVLCDGLEKTEGTVDSGADYQLNGSFVHFHPDAVPQVGWVVKLKYRPVE